MNFIPLVPLVLVLCTLTSRLSALECYSCEGRNGDICVQDPEKAKVITCKKNEKCYVMRSDSTRSFGDTVTIKRGCKLGSGSVPITHKNSDYVSSQTCTVNRCNSGDGTRLDFGGFDFNGFDYSGFGYNANHFGKRKTNAAPGNTAYYVPFIISIAAVFNYINMLQN